MKVQLIVAAGLLFTLALVWTPTARGDLLQIDDATSDVLTTVTFTSTGGGTLTPPVGSNEDFTALYIWNSNTQQPPATGVDEFDFVGPGEQQAISDVLTLSTTVNDATSNTETFIHFQSDSELVGFVPLATAHQVTETGHMDSIVTLGGNGFASSGTPAVQLEIQVASDVEAAVPLPASFGCGLALLLPLAIRRACKGRRDEVTTA